MEEQAIVIKIRAGDPLRVPKHILVADSLKFRELIEELKFEEIEIEDFSPQAVNIFLAFLEQRNLGEVEDTMFRELHKLSVVFEVEWLKESSRDWLKGKMDLATHVENKRFVFDESWYIFNKWGERCMVDGLVSVLAFKDNSTFISEYILGVDNQLKTGQIDILLKLGGSNTDLFLRIILQNLAGQRGLNENVKHLLQKMNLALCSELNEELYLEVFETLSNSPEISVADFRLTQQLIISTARIVRSRRERRKRTTLVFDEKIYLDLLTICETLSVITKAVTEERVISIYWVVELLLAVYYKNTPNRAREDTELFLETLVNICCDKKLQKVSKQHLDNIVTALNYSNLAQSDQVIALLKEIRNNDKLSTYHENVIIKLDKVITVTEGTEYKFLFSFKHPGTGTCTESDSKCGFILRHSKQDSHWTDTLCTNSEDYTGTGLHYHDIISAHEMSWYVVHSGNTPDGNKIKVVGRWWWYVWLSDITDWKFEQDSDYIAYNVTDYLVAKPE